jgi:hypothetical protein
MVDSMVDSMADSMADPMVANLLMAHCMTIDATYEPTGMHCRRNHRLSLNGR